jgi:hypothetical protein
LHAAQPDTDALLTVTCSQNEHVAIGSERPGRRIGTETQIKQVFRTPFNHQGLPPRGRSINAGRLYRSENVVIAQCGLAIAPFLAQHAMGLTMDRQNAKRLLVETASARGHLERGVILGMKRKGHLNLMWICH